MRDNTEQVRCPPSESDVDYPVPVGGARGGVTEGARGRKRGV